MKSASSLRQAVGEIAAVEHPQDSELPGGLIGDIYDAALDPELWPAALQRAAIFVGGVGASLFAQDAAHAGMACPAFGIDPSYRQLYCDTYAGLDPLTTASLAAGHEQPVAASDLMPHAEFTETRFYREWVGPQSLIDVVSVVLDRSATGATMFSVFRHERDGLVDDRARRRMMLLVPHVRRALLISRLFDVKDATAAAFSGALDGLISAMYLVDRHGRIAHANRAGQILLAACEVLRISGGRLAACDARRDRTLRDALAAAGRGDAPLGVEGIALPLTGKCGERHVAHILPLSPAARREGGVPCTVAAAVFVRKVAVQASSPSGVIGKTFKLTPAELRVLLAIVEIGGVPEVAAALGVAETTIKTHLSRLFEKTGATRQADLVKLVAGYASPLGI